MPIDRDAALKQAEKLLRQGKLDGAIAEYVRLVEDQPRDWNAINALGDLYVRAGNVDRAVAQFTQVADYLFTEGFLPKAAALYKKALKVKADHEHTLLRLSEIAAQQGLLADARTYLRTLAKQREGRGDRRGAAECQLRLALLEEADADTKLAGARAAQELGEGAQAAALFRDAADEFRKAGRSDAALDALGEAAALDPSDTALRAELARECVAAGQFERARAFLTREIAGGDPDLLLALGRMELAAGNDAEARAVFTRVLTVAPQRRADLLALVLDVSASAGQERTFAAVEILVDDAILASDWDAALDTLHRFLDVGTHIPAIVKVVELAVDAGRDDVMRAAQERLADAYLASGRGSEARVIAEDLLAREPSSEANLDRLRRVLQALGVEDAEAVIERTREAATTFDEPLDFDLDFPLPSSESVADFPADEGDANAASALEPADGPGDAGHPGTHASQRAPSFSDFDLTAFSEDSLQLLDEHGDGRSSSESPDEAIVVDMLEIDLSTALADLNATTSANAARADAPAPELESVFEDMRNRAARSQQLSHASEQYARGVKLLEEGRTAEAVGDLQAAARTPQFRFDASARLGRLHIGRGDDQQGIEWLERAAEAPSPTPEDGLAVLYDLAGALERIGETARALAVFMEIDADGAAYRDVRQRIDQLARAQAEGSRS